MSKQIKDSGEAAGPPASTAKPINSAALKKAAKALTNARQRCTNKNNPDYPNYGGAGIRMLILDRDELIADIGLPKDGYSLDRIDPYGHYEVGNVRWATRSVQDANKKASGINSHYIAAAQTHAAQQGNALRENRKYASAGWMWGIRAFNERHLLRSHAEDMAANLCCSGLLESSFDFDTVPDHFDQPPGFIHLPALSLPDARVRLRCSPAIRPATARVKDSGRLAGLEETDVGWNVPKPVWRRVSQLIAEGRPGAVIYGKPTTEDLLGGWIEGSSLAMASAVSVELKMAAACFSLLRVEGLLERKLGPSYHWDDLRHDLLDAEVLFIPDLVLDVGAWGEATSVKWWRIAELLRYRNEARLQTIVGVQNRSKLPPQLKDILLGTYEPIAMPRTAPHDRHELLYCDQEYGVPDGSVALRHLPHEWRLAHLVEHDGAKGT